MKKFDPYKAPPQEIFDEIKAKSIEIWQGYDDTYGYATEKIDRIKDLKNIKDNYYTMIGMFDIVNQAKLITKVNAETAIYIFQVLKDE